MPPGLKGPSETAEVRIRGGTLLGEVTIDVVMIEVVITTSVISFVTGVVVTVAVTILNIQLSGRAIP